jgi:3-deoxy-manno-octulosonate cytidylyltransferase (CMP-KDO synthetase)
MKILAIIPARYASTRFPGKPLVEIKGKSMIQRVFEQSSAAFEHVYVATDDERIVQHVRQFSPNVVFTRNDHKSGTDRCAEALDVISKQTGIAFDIVVNVQGDEPFIAPEQLKLLVSAFGKEDIKIATLIKVIENKSELFDPNKPKVVVDKNGKALLFSRSVIPFVRNYPQNDWLKHHTFYKHIGLYAYGSNVLRELTRLSTSTLELTESLEQLRWLENGYSIQTIITNTETVSIDTPDDLAVLLSKKME